MTCMCTSLHRACVCACMIWKIDGGQKLHGDFFLFYILLPDFGFSLTPVMLMTTIMVMMTWKRWEIYIFSPSGFPSLFLCFCVSIIVDMMERQKITTTTTTSPAPPSTQVAGMMVFYFWRKVPQEENEYNVCMCVMCIHCNGGDEKVTFSVAPKICHFSRQFYKSIIIILLWIT